MPDGHRLHADDEGVREDTEQQQRRRGAADHDIAAREMNRVRDAGGRVENQWKEVHRPVGA
jgi:hypothetical protein